MAQTCTKHDERVLLDYLPHMGWFCEVCEKEAGNVTLDGYAPEKESITVNRQAEKFQLIGEVFDNLSAQEIADLLVRRVFTNMPTSESDNAAHIKFVRTVQSVSELIGKGYEKIDDGIKRENDYSLMGILYDKGYSDYMAGRQHQESMDADLTKDQIAAYQNGWEEALERVEYGTTNN